MSQRSTFRHGVVAEGGPATLVSDLREGAAQRAFVAE